MEGKCTISTASWNNEYLIPAWEPGSLVVFIAGCLHLKVLDLCSSPRLVLLVCSAIFPSFVSPLRLLQTWIFSKEQEDFETAKRGQLW